ncbi:MAG TPA: amidohydrolase [Thermomicrobiales bacterium]|nr:amidohydrolase [Thermomicrobiales bacterium]
MVAADVRRDVDEILPGVVADRRHLHQNPELAFEEHETAKFVAERLEALGVEDIRTGVGRTGVTGLIRGTKGEGRCVLFRADMDALPVDEENEVDYKSTVRGRMHACGHDAHTAMLLGTARVLTGMRDQFAGTVKLLFQPAEEVPPGGAIEMIRDGALEDPHVDAVFGLHVAAELPAGKIGVKVGAASASSDRFRIVIQGRGGHAARPNLAIDPVVVGSHIVVALQTLVSREVDPTGAAVVTVGSIVSGEAFNVIPDTAEIKGTVRTLDPEVREQMARRVPEIAVGVGKAMRAEVDVNYFKGYPSMVNDEEMTELVREAAIDVVGAENVVDVPVGMGGEDFARFLLERPGSFFRVGTRSEERGITYGHHHPRFDVEEEGMGAGVATSVETILRYLNR